jgi:plastocyanin
LRSKAAAFFAATALTATLLPMPGAGAGDHTIYQVEIGAFLNDKGRAQSSMRFFPGELTVEPGDVLHFTAAGTHTATLLPTGQSATEWLEAYADDDGTWSYFLRDPDDGPKAMKLNTNVVFPSRDDCGIPELPCQFDGTGDPSDEGVLNSGAGSPSVPTDFSVAVNVEAGQTFTIVNLINPSMTMDVNVTSETAEASDPVEVEQEVSAQQAVDGAKASSLHSNYVNKKVKKVEKKRIKGKLKVVKVTWSAWAGVDSGVIALRTMYPAKLNISKNHFVKWDFSKLIYRGNSVTFPHVQGSATAGALPTLRCDPDGDEGTEPDTGAGAESPYCEDERMLELDIPLGVVKGGGDKKYAGGADFENSAVRGSDFSLTKSAYTLKFTKASPKAGFKYTSSTASFALGKVVVK